MPGRRGRKRKQPQRVACDPKRQAMNQSELTLEEDEIPKVTLLEHLERSLPAGMSHHLRSVRPDVRSNIPLKSVSLSPVVTLPSPSFCIGQFSLSLFSSTKFTEVLSQVRSMELDVRPNLMLYPFKPGFLEFSCDYSPNVFLPGFTTSPALFEGSTTWSRLTGYCSRHRLRLPGLYEVQFVLPEGEREGGFSGRSRTARSHIGTGSGQGTCGLENNSDTICLSGAACSERDVSVLSERQLEGRSTVQVGTGGGGGDVKVEVWVGGAMCEPSDPNALPLTGGIANLLNIMEVFHPHISSPKTHPYHRYHWKGGNSGPGIVSCIEQFYRDVKERRRERFGETESAFDTSGIRGLTAELRGYQRKAVQWMLDRERGVEQDGEDRSRLLHPLWTELSVPTGTLYCNPLTGRLTSERYCLPSPPLGGILADEMGLGKTVEVLALVMAHRPPQNTTSSRGIVVGEKKREGTPDVVVSATNLLPSQSPRTSRSSSKIRSLLGPAEPGEMTVVDVVQCVCGATSEAGDCGGEYVQCERCEVWQHSLCVHFDSTKYSSFFCLKCLLDKPLPSAATLIISPQSILQQWREEIEKHTSPNALSVLHYEGVKFSSVYPHELAAYDVVLVSYETLALELNYAKSHEVSRMLRRRKRYGTSPSPLPAVNWWRVCLDEAQMVENVVTKPAEMCQRLQAVHRWCVTGTPIQRDLSDLYGLVLFLNMDLYSEHMWYRHFITEPYLRGDDGPMVDLFSSLLWRNSKEEVAEELQLPEQSEQAHWLTFSLVEDYFYKKQRELCWTEAYKVLSRLNVGHATLGSLAQDTLQKLMTPLHTLRQACCHPQMVRRGGYVPIGNKKSLTMTQLLDKLIVQAKSEAREALRKLILSLNGLAGLYILEKEWSQACKMYLKAITTWEDYKKKEVECDRLQRIHTLENLAWLVEQGRCTEPLPIDNLKEKVQELRDQLTAKAEGQVRAAAVAVLMCQKTIRETQVQTSNPLARYLGEESAVLPLLEEECVASSTPSDQDKAVSDQDKSVSRQDEHRNRNLQASDPSIQSGSTSNPVASNSAKQAGFTSNQGASSSMETGTSSADGSSKAEKLPPITLWRDNDEYKPDLGVMWFEAAGGWVIGAGHGEQLIRTVNLSLAPNGHLLVPGGLFKEIAGLHFLLFQHFNQLESARCQSLKVLHRLLEPLTDETVCSAALCHLTERGRRGERVWGLMRSGNCTVCAAERVLVQYGTHLFSDYCGGTSAGQQHGEGSRRAHTFEMISRSLLTFLRNKNAPTELVDCGKAFVAYIDAVKKEYDALRSLWQMLSKRVSDYDELKMASTRMRYMTQTEMTEGTSDPSAVSPLFVIVKKDDFESDGRAAAAELERCLRQVVYLNNLAKTPLNDRGCCPICTRLLGTEIIEWAMLPCGHPLCMECLMMLSVKHRFSWQSGTTVRMSCPLCRFSFLSSDVNTIGSSELDDVEVKGSHSTKILGVIRTLFAIQRQSPMAKTLVFSSWLEVLTLISDALTENGLSHSYLKTAKTFQDNLSVFKKSPSVNILLLPIQSGSKGLNIVEATHVILVEPGLNIGAELQAIGRVHRMGQTKPTTVHRFMVRDSVEENIYQLLTSSSSYSNTTSLLTQKEGQSALTVGELETLFN